MDVNLEQEAKDDLNSEDEDDENQLSEHKFCKHVNQSNSIINMDIVSNIFETPDKWACKVHIQSHLSFFSELMIRLTSS